MKSSLKKKRRTYTHTHYGVVYTGQVHIRGHVFVSSVLHIIFQYFLGPSYLLFLTLELYIPLLVKSLESIQKTEVTLIKIFKLHSSKRVFNSTKVYVSPSFQEVSVFFSSSIGKVLSYLIVFQSITSYNENFKSYQLKTNIQKS